MGKKKRLRVWEAPTKAYLPPADKGDWYDSVAGVSEKTGLSKQRIRKLLREGKIKGFKVGNFWITSEKAVKDYLEQ